MAPQNRRLRRTESDVSVAGALAQPTVWVEGVQERAPYIGTSDPGAFQAAIFVVDLSLPPDWVAFGAGSLVPGLADRHAWVGTREAAVVGMKAPTVLGQSAAGVSVHVVHRGHPKRAARVLAATVACLEDFSAWFGPLSHRTLDVVLLDLPQRGLGVELPGLILLDAAGPGEATEDFIVAHEVAHQWWYGEVGSDALGEPWVDEGLAMWASLAHIAPGRRKRLTQILTWFSAATASVPATSPASDIPFDAFGLVYLRGAMYLEERRATLGNDVFLSRLKALVRDQRWGFVTADDLRARMAGSDAAERWLEAPEPGEPDRWPSFRVD
jgi:hypothetical protein